MKHPADGDELKSDPWATAVLVLLGALWMLVVIALCIPEAPNGHGVEHATIRAMDQGGDGTQRHESLLFIGWVLGSAMICLFTGLLAWGTVHRPFQTVAAEQGPALRSDGRLIWFLVGGLLFEAVFGILCYSYWESLADPGGEFSGPFPPALSWLLFGVWLFPAFFIVLYVAYFDRWILPPENAQRFEQLLDHGAVPDTSETREL